MWQNKSLEETAAEEVLEECGYSISPSKLGKNTFLFFVQPLFFDGYFFFKQKASTSPSPPSIDTKYWVFFSCRLM